MSLVIEPMRGRHVTAVEAVDAQCYSRPWSNATWRRELAGTDRLHLVGRVGDTVVGHAGLLWVMDEVHITTVAVHPDREGEGIGTRLVVALLESAGADGARSATLEVRAADRRTQRLYGRLGFQPAGIRADYYSSPTDDAVVMWLHELGSAPVVERLAAVRAIFTDGEPSSIAPSSVASDRSPR